VVGKIVSWLSTVTFLWFVAIANSGTSQVSVDPIGDQASLQAYWRCQAKGVTGGLFGQKHRAEESALLGCKLEHPRCRVESCWSEGV